MNSASIQWRITSTLLVQAPQTPAASSIAPHFPRTAENGAPTVDLSSSAAREAIMAVVSDDHSAEAGEAALRAIIAGVIQTGGTEALADLAVELAAKLAETMKQIAQDQGLLPVDVIDLLFIDSADVT